MYGGTRCANKCSGWFKNDGLPAEICRVIINKQCHFARLIPDDDIRTCREEAVDSGGTMRAFARMKQTKYTDNIG